jgi:DNA-binding MarR family transcriptional regulator
MTEVVELQDYRAQQPQQGMPAKDKFLSLRIIAGKWFDRLTPSEFMVVMFIWNRTIFWGKEKEFVKYRHFLKGIPEVIRPLPIKERRLQQIIRGLEKKGVIKRETRVYGSWYSIQHDWEPQKTARRKSKKKQRVIGTHKSAEYRHKNAARTKEIAPEDA